MKNHVINSHLKKKMTHIVPKNVMINRKKFGMSKISDMLVKDIMEVLMKKP